MKISYVMIVLNGMPFIQAALKAIYKSAHEIIIVEGAVINCAFASNADGSSWDGTVEFIKSFPDPKNKIKLIQGSWPEKCEMQNLALSKATGDYLWLVDSDEVYKESDIRSIIAVLKQNPDVYRVEVPFLHFFKGYEYVIDTREIPRLRTARVFKIEKGAYFTTHRPPTLFIPSKQKTSIDLLTLNPAILEKLGVTVYHYSYVSEDQVLQKLNLYRAYGWEKSWKMDLDEWFLKCFQKWTPENREEIEKKYRTHNCDKNSKTRRFLGTHPVSMLPIIQKHRKIVQKVEKVVKKYKPKARYCFCMMRPVSVWTQLSMIKYLNSCGETPYVMWDTAYPKVKKAIDAAALSYNVRKIGQPLDFDVMISESSGYGKFENAALKESKAGGKLNIKVNNAIATYQHVPNLNYIPEKTKDTLNGIFVKSKRTEAYYRSFVGDDIFLIEGGDPDWDQFYTSEFKEKVASVHKKYGKRILVLGTSCLNTEELEWFCRTMHTAQNHGYKVLLRIHPGRFQERIYRPYRAELNKCIDSSIPRYVHFAAASHIITNMSSSLIAEGLYLNVKTATNCMVTHRDGYVGPHVWIPNYAEWKKYMLSFAGADMIKLAPRVHTDKELLAFLKSSKPIVSEAEINQIYGWTRCTQNCEHLFQKIDKKGNF